MAIWINIELATELVNCSLEMRCKRSDSTCKNIHDRMRDVIFLDIGDTVLQGSHIIIYSLSWANIRHVNLEAIRIMVCEAAVFFCLTSNMVFQLWLILVVFRQFIHERLIAAVVTRNTF